MDSLIIYLHGNVNNSKFIKKQIPLNFDQHPPLNFGLLPFGYELWVNTTSVCIDKFSVIGV